MYSASDLTTEIRQVIDLGLDNDLPQPVHSIVAAVMGRHAFDDPDGFVTLCVDAHVRREVTKRLRDYKVGTDSSTPRQGRLPGFEHLQLAYPVLRNGEQTVVPLRQMTAAELTLKAAEIEGMAQGCIDHADELRRYRDQHFAGPTDQARGLKAHVAAA